jgi:beta-carotene ketolase (CrtW type)
VSNEGLTSTAGGSVSTIGFRGIACALTVIAAWAATLTFSLTTIHLPRDWAWALVLLPLQTFLNVGLFITAHDAMHRTLAPTMPKLNDALGRIALWCYALFDFGAVKREHFRHHATPGRDDDPDYHADERFWPWYFRFMSNYVTWRQWLGMPIAFTVLWLVFHARPLTLLTLWALPALLSSLQLFHFGTYLPHRTPMGGHADEHRATTSGYSNWKSFLTCYHFGRHWEHHAHPSAPWWRLGTITKPPAPVGDEAPHAESTARQAPPSRP